MRDARGNDHSTKDGRFTEQPKKRPARAPAADGPRYDTVDDLLRVTPVESQTRGETHGYVGGRSSRAELAEERGYRPLSRIPGGTVARQVALLIGPSEWHHTGARSHHRATDYYDAALVADTVARLSPGLRAQLLADAKKEQDERATARAAEEERRRDDAKRRRGRFEWTRVPVNRFGKLTNRLVCDRCGHVAEPWTVSSGDPHDCGDGKVAE